MAAFAGGMMNAAAGVGGVIMLIALAELCEPLTAIAIFTALVLCSSIARTAADFKYINWAPLLQFGLGCIAGTFAARPFIGLFEGPVFMIVLAVFMLFILWTPHLHLYRLFPKPFFVCGFFMVALGILLGAAGPLPVIFLLDTDIKKDHIVATAGAMQTLSDATKTLTFISVGFPYHSYLPMLAILFLCIILGTFAGRWIRHRLNETTFRFAVRVLTSIVVSRMLIMNLIKVIAQP